MTMGTPHVGLNSTISYGVTVSAVTTYTAINNVESVDGPNESLSIVEVTPLGSTYKGKLPSVSDAGEVNFSIFYDGTDSTHQFLTGLLGTTTLCPFKIDYPDGTSAKFSGFLSAFGTKGLSAEEAVTADCTISISGAVQWSTSP